MGVTTEAVLDRLRTRPVVESYGFYEQATVLALAVNDHAKALRREAHRMATTDLAHLAVSGVTWGRHLARCDSPLLPFPTQGGADGLPRGE